MHEYFMSFDECLLTDPTRANALLACYCERQGLERKHTYVDNFIHEHIEEIKTGKIVI